MFFSESPEKKQIRSKIRNKSITNYISNDHKTILHCGIGDRGKSLLNFLIENYPDVNYLGIDADSLPVEINLPENFSLEKKDIQSFLEESIENQKQFDWLILTGVLDKNVYGDNQYEFVDTFLRKCLEISKEGIVISFNTYQTNEDDTYNVEFLIAYINSMYASYNIHRVNDNEYVITLFSRFY